MIFRVNGANTIRAKGTYLFVNKLNPTTSCTMLISTNMYPVVNNAAIKAFAASPIGGGVINCRNPFNAKNTNATPRIYLAVVASLFDFSILEVRDKII